MEIVNRVKVGFFSFSHSSPTGDDQPYLEWHQMDHMPEQYQLPGLLLAQRWASTPACRAARAVESGDWSKVEHVVCYLMGNPVDETIDEFLTLGRHLAELGRFPHSLPSQYRGGLRLLEAAASPRVLVSAEVVPYRPHQGVYLIVEEIAGSPADRAAREEALKHLHTDVLPALVTVPGVAGVWTYATTPSIRRSMFSEGDYQITTCYLDDDPASVAAGIVPVLADRWASAPVQPVLASPFESLLSWDWTRFRPGSFDGAS